MPTSGYDPETNCRMLPDTGLTILTDQILTWHHGQVTYRRVIASKSSN